MKGSGVRVPASALKWGILRRDTRAVGMGFLVDHGAPLEHHRRTVLRLLVRPELQGSARASSCFRGWRANCRPYGGALVKG